MSLSYASLNWQHFHCQNPADVPDLRSSFMDHKCNKPDSSQQPATNNQLIGSTTRSKGLFQLGSNGVCDHVDWVGFSIYFFFARHNFLEWLNVSFVFRLFNLYPHRFHPKCQFHHLCQFYDQDQFNLSAQGWEIYQSYIMQQTKVVKEFSLMFYDHWFYDFIKLILSLINLCNCLV